MHDQPWSVILVQAEASRSRMLDVWYALPTRSDDAAWWVAKSGADHYREHLGRLRRWVDVLHERRTARERVAAPPNGERTAGGPR
jgi:hypothetical protein